MEQVVSFLFNHRQEHLSKSQFGVGARPSVLMLKQLMSANSAFHPELADKFKLRPYKFAATPERVQNAAELSGSGEETNLTSALDQAQRLP